MTKLLWAEGRAEVGAGGRAWYSWACLTFLEANSPRCVWKDNIGAQHGISEVALAGVRMSFSGCLEAIDF